jgi:ABC-type amino acid transport system permease subunit
VVAEIIRARINAVHQGSIEAARSLGLSYVQTMRYVALPTALRCMAPALVSQLISINKDTSFASVVSVQELLRRAEILNTIGFNPLQNLLVVESMCWAINFVVWSAGRRLELRD